MTETYPKLTGGAGIHGAEYQIKLLTYFLLNDYVNNKTSFRLSTENKLAKGFDDVVYETSKVDFIIQAKHYLSNVFKFSHIDPRNKDDFALSKYFENCKETNCFEKLVNKNDKYLIFATNVEISEKTEYVEELIVKRNRDDGQNYIFTEFEGINEYYTFNNNIRLLLFENLENFDKFFNYFLEKLVLIRITDDYLEDKIQEFVKKIIYIQEENRMDFIRFLYNEVKNWFTQPKGIYFTFADVERIIADFNTVKYIAHIKMNIKWIFKTFEMTEIKKKKKVCYEIKCKEFYEMHVLKLLAGNQKKQVIVGNLIDFLNSQTNIIPAFMTPSPVLLIIPLFEQVTEDIQDKLGTMLESISAKDYKTVIFITHNRDIISQFEPDITINEPIKFSDFESESQTRILSKELDFQGRNLQLTEVLEGDVNNVLDEDTLVEISSDKKIKIYSYDDKKITNFYIPRTIRFPYLDQTEENFAKWIVNEPKSKLLVIADEAGMGKSTILSNLKNNLIINHNYWIPKIDLNMCQSILDKYTHYEDTKYDIKRFLCDINQITCNFDKRLFDVHKIIIIFDGFDDVSPDYDKVVLTLIKNCLDASNIKRIIVTTRNNCQHILNFPNSVVCSLQPLNKEEQFHFLLNYWLSQLTVEKEKKCSEFVDEIITKMSENLRYRSVKTFLSNPLHCSLVAKIFENNCLSYINTGTFDQSALAELNLTQVYTKFINKIKEDYMKKNNVNGNITLKRSMESSFNMAMEYHRKCALQLLFPEHVHRYFRIPQYSFSVYDHDISNRIGILNTAGSSFRFIHQTFAEYFVAEHLTRIINESSNDSNFLKILVTEVLLKPKFTAVQIFMEAMLKGEILSDEIFIAFGRELTKALQTENDFNFITINRCYTLLEILLKKCYSLQKVNTKYLIWSVLDDIKLVTLLKDKGVDLHQVNQEKQSLLHKAILINNETVAIYLIDFGLDINHKDNFGNCPLHYAVESNNKNIVSKLLSNSKINRNSLNNNGESALHIAARENLIDIQSYLIGTNVEIDSLDINNRTPFLTAIVHRNYEFAKLLFNYIKTETTFIEKSNVAYDAMLYTIQNDAVDFLKFLLKEIYPINQTDNDGVTPLMLACRYKSFSCAYHLIDSGCDVTRIDRNWKNIFNYATNHSIGLDESNNYCLFMKKLIEVYKTSLTNLLPTME
ncbi:uncharacterized protein [Diabrotica undecimpunctata]|uniref:uncharacterized protein n=1 Tax=Diabrotica undecimpunctata TaxID=50387 RepID=UPI003B6334BD